MELQLAIHKQIWLPLTGAALAAVLLTTACHKTTPSSHSDIRPEMRLTYAAAHELYGYVWNPPAFNDPANRERILSLLDQMSTNFHRIQNVAKDQAQDPGFKVTLDTQQNLLQDARNRFVQGKLDYSNWRLRNVSTNCISCHTRQQIKVDFLGDEPVPQDTSFESKLSSAEFLLATRQFDRASTQFLTLAKEAAPDPQKPTPRGSLEAIKALKNWLLVEVRVKDRPGQAAKTLRETIPTLGLSKDHSKLATFWGSQLAELEAQKARQLPWLAESESLVPASDNATTEAEDLLNLPRTLRATALLHPRLGDTALSPESGQPTPGVTKLTDLERRRALLILARAYSRVPLPSMDGFKAQYLEQSIREFPHTDEAKEALIILENYTEETHSGSGGYHLEVEERERLEELRKLAN